jgi:hypothetical protein
VNAQDPIPPFLQLKDKDNINIYRSLAIYIYIFGGVGGSNPGLVHAR